MLLRAVLILTIAVGVGAFGRTVCPAKYRQLRFNFEDPEKPKPDLYLVKDPAHEDFEISGKVQGRDLYLSFQTKLEDGTRGNLVAKEHFPKILEHFDGKFDRIMGQWSLGPMQTNLNTFNWISRKQSKEDAALSTWTGRQAAARGYTKVTFVTLEGRRGKYTRVLVAFEKP